MYVCVRMFPAPDGVSEKLELPEMSSACSMFNVMRSNHFLNISATGGLSVTTACLELVRYINLADEPSPSMRRAQFIVQNGEHYSVSFVNISINLTCDVPTVNLTVSAVEFDEQAQAPVQLFPGINITNTDQTSHPIVRVSIRIRSDTFEEEHDNLILSRSSLSPLLNISTNVPGRLLLTGSASVADYIFALRNVFFLNSFSGLNTTSRIVEIDALTNCTGQVEHQSSRTAQVTVAIRPLNDAPVLRLNGQVSVSFSLHQCPTFFGFPMLCVTS